jgi:hypothetical protein
MSFGQTIYGITSCMSWWHGSLEQSSMKLGSELVFDDAPASPTQAHTQDSQLSKNSEFGANCNEKRNCFQRFVDCDEENNQGNDRQASRGG